MGGGVINKVKELRLSLGLSQLALAQAVGVARQTINLIENQKYNPSLDLCIKLAETLESDLNTLFWETRHDKATNNQKGKSYEKDLLQKLDLE